MPAYNGSLFRQPASRLLQFVRREKIHWRATDSRSGKSERKSLPTWFSDDGDLGNLTANPEARTVMLQHVARDLAEKVERATRADRNRSDKTQ